MSEKKKIEFLKYYNKCHSSFVKYCTALAYGRLDTEDLIQDVMLSAFQNFEKIKNKEQLLHYLVRAARFKSISRWRRNKYKTEYLDLHDNRLLAKGVSAETLLDIQFLYKSIDKLPEKQKDALVLFEVSGFSMKEIAKMHQSTEGAIKTKISRARKNLKQIMSEDNNSIKISGTLKFAAL